LSYDNQESYIEIQGESESYHWLHLVVAGDKNTPEGRKHLEEIQQQIQKEHEFYVNCREKYPNLANYVLGLLEKLKESDKKYTDLVAEIKQVVDGGEYFDICDVLTKHELALGDSKP